VASASSSTTLVGSASTPANSEVPQKPRLSAPPRRTPRTVRSRHSCSAPPSSCSRDLHKRERNHHACLGSPCKLQPCTSVSMKVTQTAAPTPVGRSECRASTARGPAPTPLAAWASQSAGAGRAATRSSVTHCSRPLRTSPNAPQPSCARAGTPERPAPGAQPQNESSVGRARLVG
jgi:hypothetical protein